MLVFSGSFMGTVHSRASFASLKLSLIMEKCFFLVFTFFDFTLLFLCIPKGKELEEGLPGLELPC